MATVAMPCDEPGLGLEHQRHMDTATRLPAGRHETPRAQGRDERRLSGHDSVDTVEQAVQLARQRGEARGAGGVDAGLAQVRLDRGLLERDPQPVGDRAGVRAQRPRTLLIVQVEKADSIGTQAADGDGREHGGIEPPAEAQESRACPRLGASCANIGRQRIDGPTLVDAQEGGGALGPHRPRWPPTSQSDNARNAHAGMISRHVRVDDADSWWPLSRGPNLTNPDSPTPYLSRPRARAPAYERGPLNRRAPDPPTRMGGHERDPRHPELCPSRGPEVGVWRAARSAASRTPQQEHAPRLVENAWNSTSASSARNSDSSTVAKPTCPPASAVGISDRLPCGT